MIHKKYVLLLVAAILVASLAVTGCSKKAPILKAADKHGLVFGTAITAGDIFDPEMKEFITSHFNLVVPENTMKWVNIRPTKQFWNWSDLDKMVDFAEENDIIIKGHPLIWDEQTPGFVNSVKTKEAALEIIVEHITEIMTRYKGRIQMYDVVNELRRRRLHARLVLVPHLRTEFIDVHSDCAKLIPTPNYQRVQ